MNENFNQALLESGLTMYQLAKKTGISYSLINDLAHEKKPINQRSAEQVGRLASVFGKSISDILDPYCVVEGLSGSVAGTKYKVGYENGQMYIDIFQGNGTHRIVKDQLYCIPRYRDYYELAVESSVENYLEEKKKKEEFEQRMLEVMRRRGIREN